MKLPIKRTQMGVVRLAPLWACMLQAAVGSELPHVQPLAAPVKSADVVGSTHHVPGPVLSSMITAFEAPGLQALDVEALLDACKSFLEFWRQMGVGAPLRVFDRNLQKCACAAQHFGGHGAKRKGVTLESLLAAERSSGTIGPDGTVSQSSGSWGWLWNCRMLSYQCALFAAVLRAPPGDAEAPRRAALAAYEQELGPHHSPILRNVYRFGLPRGVPKRPAFLRSLGAVSSSATDEGFVLAEMARVVELWRPLLARWREALIKAGVERGACRDAHE